MKSRITTCTYSDTVTNYNYVLEVQEEKWVFWIAKQKGLLFCQDVASEIWSNWTVEAQNKTALLLERTEQTWTLVSQQARCLPDHRLWKLTERQVGGLGMKGRWDTGRLPIRKAPSGLRWKLFVAKTSYNGHVPAVGLSVSGHFIVY